MLPEIVTLYFKDEWWPCVCRSRIRIFASYQRQQATSSNYHWTRSIYHGICLSSWKLAAEKQNSNAQRSPIYQSAPQCFESTGFRRRRGYPWFDFWERRWDWKGEYSVIFSFLTKEKERLLWGYGLPDSPNWIYCFWTPLCIHKILRQLDFNQFPLGSLFQGSVYCCIWSCLIAILKSWNVKSTLKKGRFDPRKCILWKLCIDIWSYSNIYFTSFSRSNSVGYPTSVV